MLPDEVVHLDQVLRMYEVGTFFKPLVTREEMAGRQMLTVATAGSSMNIIEGVVEFPITCVRLIEHQESQQLYASDVGSRRAASGSSSHQGPGNLHVMSSIPSLGTDRMA